MRYGVCIGSHAEKLRVLKDCGYDFAEVTLSAIADWNEEQIAAFCAESERTGIFAEAANGFFAFPEGSLTGADADFSAIEAYTRRALRNAARLGVKVAVLGSGKARKIPDDTDREAGTERFCRVLRIAGTVGAEEGIGIVIEPLNPAETNLVNSVAEGLELCRRTNHPNVSVLADFYHMAVVGEEPDILGACGTQLHHVHLAAPDRQIPTDPAQMPLAAAYAAQLKKIGYDRRISLEGNFTADWEENARKTRAFLKLFD